MSKTQISDLATYRCHIAGCEEVCILPYPFCATHNRMVPDDIMSDAEEHLVEGADGVRGGYTRWRKDVCRAIDAVNAKVQEQERAKHEREERAARAGV